MSGPEFLNLCVRAAIFIVILLTAFAYLTYLERRVLSWFQWRVGPNRVGPWGLFQPLADGVKTVLKQEMIPRKADKVLYMIAPAITLAGAFTMFAIIPVGDGVWISNVAVAILLFMGLSGLGAYGIIIAGWASQSRYPFLGALRSCAQIISYELSLGMALLVPIMIVGSLNINELGNIYHSPSWSPVFFIVLIPAAVVFTISALAETARIPFDLPECESEIVAGYHTEYSSLKYAMFPMGEYVAMCAMAAIATHLFLGGYHLNLTWLGLGDYTNWLGAMTGHPNGALVPNAFGLEGEWANALSWTFKGFSTTMTFIVKVALVVLTFMWVRATFPRMRYDQLMRLGWKWLLPAGIALVLVTSILMTLLAGTPVADETVVEAGLNNTEVMTDVTL